MTDKEVLVERNSREMMKRPHLWPHKIRFGWGMCPVLPLRHPIETRDGWARLAIWICIESWGGGCRWAVKRDGMLLMLVQPQECEYGNDELIEKMMLEGWEVD